MNKINPIFSAMTDIDNSIITDAKKPRKSPKVLIIAAAVAAAAAGITIFAGNYNLPHPFSGIATADEPDLHPTIIDYSEVKEGYYLSEQGDDSYIVIKDGKFTVVGYDFEKAFREDNPPENFGMEKDTSEYEELISEGLKLHEDFTDVTFVPVKFYGYPEGYTPEGMLVRDVPADEIESAGRLSGLGMKGEDRLFFGENHFYTYYGTSLPE